jgi:hypothetical protein
MKYILMQAFATESRREFLEAASSRRTSEHGSPQTGLLLYKIQNAIIVVKSTP